MPFEKFPNAMLPAMGRGAPVQVLFKGLTLINPNQNGTLCEIALHRLTDDHFPVIEIRGKTEILVGTSVVSTRDFLVARMLGPLTATLKIEVDPLPVNHRVYAFHPTPNPFNRATSRNFDDLRWGADIQDPEYFHNVGDIRLFRSGADPCLEIRQAVFFTADITDPDDVEVRVTGPGIADDKDLVRIAAVVGAFPLLPDENHRVVVSGGPLTAPIILPRLDDDPATTYTISVRNEPLAINFQPTHGELEQYYEILRKSNGTVFSVDERKEVRFSPPHSFTDEIPCIPTLNGGGGFQ